MHVQLGSPGSSPQVVAFTLGIIAFMMGLAWHRDREPGMGWFGAGYLLNTVLVALDGVFPPGVENPNMPYLMATYVVRGLCATGLTHYLGMPRAPRRWLLVPLLLPALAVSVAWMAGMTVGRTLGLVPLLAIDAGLAALCVVAGRRSPGEGHSLLALGALIGPVMFLLLQWANNGPYYLRQQYGWPAAVGFGIVLLVVSLMRQTQRTRRLQALAQRMSNFYAALSQTNQTILRVDDPTRLCNELCRICVDTGHALMACVYLREGDQVTRLAQAGPVDRVLKGFPNPWSLTTDEARASYTSQALVEGRPVVSNDYQNDPRGIAWRDRAVAHGVKAMAWLPLRRSVGVTGVVMLGATEAGYFDAPLVKLLEDMACDISFALDNLDREAARVRAAREAEAALLRFKQLFNASPVAAAIISLADRRIIDVNDATARRYELPREQLIGRTTATLPHSVFDEDREVFYEQLEQHGQVSNLIVRSLNEAGALRHELVNAELIDYTGERCHLVLSLDISDLRAAEEARNALAEAEMASRAKTEFLSRMSHELRTPLNTVLGFSDLLRRRAPGPLTPREAVQIDHIHRAGWHLLALVNDVLDVSRIEAGDIGVEAQAVDLTLLLDEVTEMSRPQAMHCAVTLDGVYQAHARKGVLADARRLRQVMLNLLSNAIKYNRPGGLVRVRVAVQGDHVQIEVVDNGLGMTQVQLDHLYEPFNRLGRERGNIEGTGIGLTLTRQLVRLMGGQLVIESQSGQGTRACVRLPCIELASQAFEPTAAADLPPEAADPDVAGIVVYIEDNPVNTMLVEQLLSRWGQVRFVPAEDGASGIELVRSLRPDLVLLDMHLPDMSGLDILRTLRGDAALPGLPIVALSANVLTEEIQQARDEGITDYWAKPLEHDRFLADVARLLRQTTAAH